MIQISGVTRRNAHSHSFAIYRCEVCGKEKELQCKRVMPEMCASCYQLSRKPGRWDALKEFGLPMYARMLVTEVIGCMIAADCKNDWLWSADLADCIIAQHIEST